jgi:VCBS repeat-containing protein
MAISTTSYTKTPQAGDDSYIFAEDILRDSTLFNIATNVLTLDVMSNDLGGNAKKLFSISDADGNAVDPSALLTADVAGTWETTDQGNQIRIFNGKIEYDMSGTLGGGGIDSLAQGEAINDTFTYAIRLGNGTLSWATVSVHIDGSNDGPVANDMAVQVNEDATVTQAFAADDIDSDDDQASLTYTVVDQSAQGAVTVNADGTFTFDAADFDSLPAGETVDVTFSYKATDSHGAESAVKTVTVTVTGVNDAPEITSGATASVDENAPASTIIYTATATDPDAGDTITWSLTGTDAALLSIDASGNVTLNASADFEAKSSYSFNVVATDGGGLSDSQTVTLSVNDVNETPTVTSGDSASVDENAATSTVVYAAVAADPDAGDTITWSLSGADAALLSIDAGGNVTLNASADFEAKSSYSFDVVATDGGGLSDSQAVTLSINNVNEAPTVTSGDSVSVNENAVASTIVYTAAVSDPDAGDTISWSLSGTDAALLSIDAGGNVTLNASADFEAKSSYSFDVVATDGGGLSDSQAVTLSINNVNEAPVVTSGDSASVDENAPASTVVYTAVATDVDAGDTITWSLSGTDAALLSIDASGNVTLNASADYETKSSYSFNVVATDAGGLSDDQAVTLSIGDVSENAPPSATNDRWFISDGTIASLAATTAMLGNDSDPDGDPVAITALSNDGSAWVTDATDGLVDQIIHLDTAKGNLTVNTLTGAITYTTDSQTADVTDTFHYRISDNDATPLSDEGMVTVLVEDIGNGSTADTINLSAETYQVSYISSGNGIDSVTGGSGTDTFLGGPSNDILIGGNGNDVLFGDGGDDSITGNGGNDTIDVTSGNDIVLYTSKLDGNDVLVGFDATAGGGQDVINLDALFDTYGALSGTRADHVSVVQSGADTLVLVDTDNSFTAGNNATYEMTITLTSITSSTITLGSDINVGS